MTRAWGVLCDSWKGSHYASCGSGLWTAQVVRLATQSKTPWNSGEIPWIHIQAAGRCAKCDVRDMSSAASKRERQDLLRQSQDSTRWWDNCEQEINSRRPDFRHKEFVEAHWLNNCYKTAWEEAPLATPGARVEQSIAAAGPWGLSSDYANQIIGPGFDKQLTLDSVKKLSQGSVKGVVEVLDPEAQNCSTPEFVKKLCKQGQVKGAVEVLEVLAGRNFVVDKNLLYSVLKECVAKKDLMLGGQVHALTLKLGFGSDTFLSNHFIRMYAGHGKLQEAANVFRGVALPNAFTWSAIISAHTKEGQAERAIELYQHMRATRTKPDNYVFVAALQACAAAGDLRSGKHMHDDVLACGMEHDMFICNCLIEMYIKCGSLMDARKVFDGLKVKNVVTWTVMIAGYAKVEGMGQEALDLYSTMHNEGMTVPDAVAFVCLLQACANVGVSALEKGKQLHSQIKERGLEFDMAVGGSLVNMYSKCGSLVDARTVFDRLPEKNLMTWTAMLAGYAKVEGMGHDALSLYNAMQNEDIAVPDAVTFVCLLQACANVGLSALEKGKHLHLQLKERGLESNVAMGASLVNMYAKCGSLSDARTVFDGLREKNVVTWSAMIAGYAKVEGMGQDALTLHSAMHKEGMTIPNVVTYVCLLQACANVGVSALEKGRLLHSEVKDRGLESDKAVGGSLVNMYAKCGSLVDARTIFDGLREKNVVAWNAMITGYAQQEGMGHDALNLHSAMHDEGIAIPDVVTYVCLLQACASVGVSASEKGKQLHAEIIERSLESELVLGGSLVNMYAKCGSLTDSRIVFDGLREKNVVTWNAMLAGYAQQEGMGQGALELYSAMQKEDMVSPNVVTFVCLLQACASVGALQQGKELHSEIRERGFESIVLIGPCLVKMYAQCGCLEVSRDVFDRLSTKSIETWNALIKGYAEHKEGCMAIQCFQELLEQGIQPDEVTYSCLLTACSLSGLVDEGQRYFETMEKRHGVKPNEWHYSCMVDLLGRSGHLDRAEQMLRSSDLAGSVVSWTALLSACKSYGEVEVGRRCFDHLVSLQPSVATAYVLLGSIYANAGRWDEVERVEVFRKAAGARKKAAKACIEVHKEVHEFTVGEERSDVAATLRKMSTRVKEGGHVPQTQLVLRAVSEQEKEDALCGHAEKLALAYGLCHTPVGTTLIVTKNLRMCDDCHSSTKVMSRVEKREIVVRDCNMVHRFRNGGCSCQERP